MFGARSRASFMIYNQISFIVYLRAQCVQSLSCGLCNKTTRNKYLTLDEFQNFGMSNKCITY